LILEALQGVMEPGVGLDNLERLRLGGS